MNKAMQDIVHERERQIEKEGWSLEHDDAHTKGELAAAATCYAASCVPNASMQEIVRCMWPFDLASWKPSTGRRRDLVKAGALILAEIERIDRSRVRR